MDKKQEIAAESDAWKASIKKHGDQEHSVSFADLETRIISLGDTYRIVLKHGDHDLYHG